MTEVAGKVAAEQGSAGKFAGLLASGAFEEAEKLTLEMIRETAEWLKTRPEAVKAAEVVREWWCRQIEKAEGEDVAQHLRGRWGNEFGKARQRRFAEKAKAELARIAEAKAQPKAKALPEVIAPKVAPKPSVAKPSVAPPWPEAPLPPEGASPEERLLYPPGLLGHVVQHIIDTDMYPDRRMALWGALAACSKALDRKVIGPTGSTTLLYLILLAATAAGKQHSHDCIRILLRAMGIESLIQAGSLASVQATEDIVKATPNCLVLIDEFGRWFRMILSQTTNVKELPGTLCKFWAIRPAGSWAITRRAKEIVETVSIDWPALALSGCSTREPFWDACSDDEITGGFLNRCVIFDAGTGAEKRARPKYAWDELPKWLAKELKDRAGIPAGTGASIITKTEGLLGPRRMSWGEGAEELWEKAADEIRALPEGRKRDIFARGDELAVRLATVRAWWRGSAVVEIADWEWGFALAQASCKLVLKGANENMGVKRDFKKICKHIIDLLTPGPMRIGEIHVHSRTAAGDRGMEIVDKAINDLILSEEIDQIFLEEQEKLGLAPKGAGRKTEWFRLRGKGK